MKKLSEKEIVEFLTNLEGWELQDGSITKTFTFKDFKEAFGMMTQIAFECEAQNHHPDWENVYNRLTISLNTHDVGGITMNDISLAKTIEQIIQSK